MKESFWEVFAVAHYSEKVKRKNKNENKNKSFVSSLSHFHKRSKEKLEIHPWMSIIFLFSEVKSFRG